MESIILGFSLSLLNAVIALIFYRYAMNSKNENFNRIIFGSLTARFFFICATIWLIMNFCSIDKLLFSIAFAISVFIMIFIEIFFVIFRTNLLNLKKHK